MLLMLLHSLLCAPVLPSPVSSPSHIKAAPFALPAGDFLFAREESASKGTTPKTCARALREECWKGLGSISGSCETNSCPKCQCGHWCLSSPLGGKGGSRGPGMWGRFLLPFTCQAAVQLERLPYCLVHGYRCKCSPCPSAGSEPIPAGHSHQSMATHRVWRRLGRAKRASGLPLHIRDAQRDFITRRSPLSLLARRRPRTRQRPEQWRSSSSKDKNQLRRCSGKDQGEMGSANNVILPCCFLRRGSNT